MISCSNNHSHFFSPEPFVIIDIVFKKKIERIQDDFLYRMKTDQEPRFFAYLNELIEVKK